MFAETLGFKVIDMNWTPIPEFKPDLSKLPLEPFKLELVKLKCVQSAVGSGKSNFNIKNYNMKDITDIKYYKEDKKSRKPIPPAHITKRKKK
jgi:hypothetical protein